MIKEIEMGRCLSTLDPCLKKVQIALAAIDSHQRFEALLKKVLHSRDQLLNSLKERNSDPLIRNPN